MSLFEWMVNVKPAHLREVYHELTVDSCDTSSETERQANECVRQILELKETVLAM